ncbi:class A beta-lactamase-related serine hydrolase [Actinocorallia sp. API 0066]|uniref:serine hydrolase n=1 Tax=Actinocorallia sp. API 0066 TaxID=2896846 RepID=UPI001E4BD8AD|nr:serine hydrolase [Actinocorallia sp. API 0066]MCD0448075.1 class A beta-lactamase-related serine hydrolase [Actinocorallia sp. API 0066]
MSTLRRAAAAVLSVALLAVCAADRPDRSKPVPPDVAAPAPAPTATAPPPARLDKAALDRALSKYLAGRVSAAGIMAVDRVTGARYAFRANEEFVTASVAKLDIAMTLLLRRQKAGQGLSAAERDDVKIMIRDSDNEAADRSFVRAGSATGVNTANRRSFGLRSTTAIDASCLDLLCWSLTTTTPADRVRLLQRLFTGPLNERNRAFLLAQMGAVQEDQRWGLEAGALDGDALYVKNGWMTHARDGERWAVNSVGRIEGHGHDLLVAVMTRHNPSHGYGITTAQHLVARVADAFRATTAASDAAGPLVAVPPQGPTTTTGPDAP